MPRCLGGILVGGKARRLGGLPKGLITINMRSLIELTIEALAPFCDEIVLLGNADHYTHLNVRRLPDVYPDAGPLSGLSTALNETESEVIIVPCDLPYISRNVFEKLTQYSSGYPLACKGPQRSHPLVARYPKSVSAMIQRFARAQNSVHAAFEACNGRWVEFECEKPFTNVNTPEELARLSNEQNLLTQHV